MPILDTSDTIVNADPITPDRKLYTNPEFKTSTLFNKDHELNDIIQYVEGGKWSVDYFQQIREINTPAVMPDVNTSSTVLSYNRINKLILFVDTAINQDDPNNITGTATINAGFVPSYGDPFIATLTGGREAIFVIEEVNKKLYSLHDMFEVNFKLLVFLDKDSLFYRDLISKVMKEYVYDLDYIKDKSSPIILAKDYKDKLDIKKEYTYLLNYYYNTMFNKDKNIITFPIRFSTFYLDTYLTNFLFKINGRTGYPNSNKITTYEVPTQLDYTIYDMLINRDDSKFDFLDKDIGFTRLPSSTSVPVLRHIGWLGINYIVDKLPEGTTPVDIDADIIENTLTLPTDYIEPLGATDNNYIFSEFFYIKDIANCGIMEKAVLQYMRNEVVDMDNINIMIKQYRYWTTLEQFYLLPILMLLLKDSISKTFSSI